MIPQHYNEDELAQALQDLPKEPHPRFIDRTKDVYSNGARVVGFLGKEKTKYFWAVKCFVELFLKPTGQNVIAAVYLAICTKIG